MEIFSAHGRPVRGRDDRPVPEGDAHVGRWYPESGQAWLRETIAELEAELAADGRR